jgi:hypothetical protein
MVYPFLKGLASGVLIGSTTVPLDNDARYCALLALA